MFPFSQITINKLNSETRHSAKAHLGLHIQAKAEKQHLEWDELCFAKNHLWGCSPGLDSAGVEQHCPLWEPGKSPGAAASGSLKRNLKGEGVRARLSSGKEE